MEIDTLSNRELLGLAAKAVGYERLPVEGFSMDSAKGMRLVDADNEFVRYWNPLINDDDARQLAIAIHAYDCIRPDGKGIWGINGETDEAHLVKLRRLIVMAAAKYGAAKQSEEFGDTPEQAASAQPSATEVETPSLDELRAEVARLTACLKRANNQAEEFERKWYLSCDEVEALRVERDALQSKVAELTPAARPETNRTVTFGGRCVKHPLQVVPCSTCLAEAQLIEQGICPECEGSGEQGGQFCGGYWKCEACKGTGKPIQKSKV